jgi:hypothetical protein
MRIRGSSTRRLAGLLFSGGVLLQFGSCDIGEITTTTTLDGREAVIQIVRGAILTPIDAYITNVITEFFEEE